MYIYTYIHTEIQREKGTIHAMDSMSGGLEKQWFLRTCPKMRWEVMGAVLYFVRTLLSDASFVPKRQTGCCST
jgi:hypothetical protein